MYKIHRDLRYRDLCYSLSTYNKQSVSLHRAYIYAVSLAQKVKIKVLNGVELLCITNINPIVWGRGGGICPLKFFYVIPKRFEKEY